MADCKLNKYDKYPVSSVTHDQATNRYVVRLKGNPAGCPEGIFTSRSLIVKKGADTDVLAYSTQANAPVLAIQNSTAITEVADPINIPTHSGGLGFFGWLVLIAVLAGIIYAVRRYVFANERAREENDTPYQPRPRSTYAQPQPAAQPTQQEQPQRVVHEHVTVVQQPAVDPLAAGFVGYELGQMSRRADDSLAREIREDRMYQRERDLERERRELEEERANLRQQAQDDEDDSFESDDDEDEDERRSSDSGSSFSSDDSSFSSDDSSSSFSSDDSSSTFSSD